MRVAEVIVSLANGRRVPFDVDSDRAGAAFFLLGVRKCGSSLLNMLCAHLAMINNRRFIDVGDKFFFANVPARVWSGDPALCDLLSGGNVYGGFREMPIALAQHPIFRAGPKILMIRDPRDALVSEYFSSAYSHPVPPRTRPDAPMTDLMEGLRREALDTEIDAFVIKRARWMQQAFLGYTEVARLAGTIVIRYEDYIFHKPELVRLIARQFSFKVEDDQISQMMTWADKRPAIEEPTAFVRRVTPGDHQVKLRPATIDALDELLKPAMDAFGYPCVPDYRDRCEHY
jgi:hypothetical protein